MKLLFDFLPIVLFFGTFKYAEAQKDWAARFASDHFGFLVSGGVVGPGEAPVLLATLVVIAATALQVVYLLARGKKVDLMLWVSLGIVVTLGGATVWFHSEEFIKWKPSVLHWFMALSLWVSQSFFGKNLIKAMMGKQIELPDAVWRRLNLAWVAFFGVMGFLNLYVVRNFSTDAWVNFKLFGFTGLMVLFVIAQGVYLTRHIKPETAESDTPKLPG